MLLALSLYSVALRDELDKREYNFLIEKKNFSYFSFFYCSCADAGLCSCYKP